MGAGFTFVARQKQIEIDQETFRIDLLLYNRKLRRLVVVELKVGPFKAEYKGQMELYLRWLDQYDRATGEQAPIGLILCATKDAEQVKLMDMEASNIRVAEYLAHIPDMKVLQAQLHRAVALARDRAAQGLLSNEQKDAGE